VSRVSWKSLLVAAGVAALLVPAAAAAPAKHARHLHLALVPLQQAQLPNEAASFALSSERSGVVANQDAGNKSFLGLTLISGPSFKKLGRITGYALDYGDSFSGGTGVLEISTRVDEYRTARGAVHGVAAGRRIDGFFRILDGSVLSMTTEKLKAPNVGTRGFAELVSASVPNLNPIVMLDEEVTDGRFVLDDTVIAGSASAAKHAAPALLRKLDRRLRLMLAGRLKGKPVHIPPPPDPGPPPGGPDLSTLILQPSDVGQSQVVNLFQGYGDNPSAISDYFMEMDPAGPYDELLQEIGWYPTPIEATYAATYTCALFGAIFSSGSGGTVTPVDVSSVGDNASGTLIQEDGASVVTVVLTNGQAGDFAFGLSEQTLHASDVQNLAQAMANRLDAGLGGLAPASYVPTTWTSQRRSRSRSSSMKSTRCHVPSWSSLSRTGTDSPAVPSSIAMQCEWPLP
jgi:hypothetical protein